MVVCVCGRRLMGGRQSMHEKFVQKYWAKLSSSLQIKPNSYDGGSILGDIVYDMGML